MHRLISEKLVSLIEKNTSIILDRWSDSLLSDPTTSTFSKEHLDYIIGKAKFLINNLGQWLSHETDRIEIGRRYEKQGVDLFGMGIPLCEAVRAMVVLRRIIWLFVVDESAYDSAFQLHQMREFNDRLILFFDRAQYYFIRAYMEAMHKEMKKLWDLNDKETEKIFFEKSFYNR